MSCSKTILQNTRKRLQKNLLGYIPDQNHEENSHGSVHYADWCPVAVYVRDVFSVCVTFALM